MNIYKFKNIVTIKEGFIFSMSKKQQQYYTALVFEDLSEKKSAKVIGLYRTKKRAEEAVAIALFNQGFLCGYI